MKPITVLLALLVISCSDNQVQELAFRKTLEYKLINLCGEENKACVAAVKSQIKGCMEKSDWRRFMDNQNNKTELNRFTQEFYACIVDADGKPFFYVK